MSERESLRERGWRGRRCCTGCGWVIAADLQFTFGPFARTRLTTHLSVPLPSIRPKIRKTIVEADRRELIIANRTGRPMSARLVRHGPSLVCAPSITIDVKRGAERLELPRVFLPDGTADREVDALPLGHHAELREVVERDI